MDFFNTYSLQLTIILICILFMISIFKNINKNKIRFEEASYWFIKAAIIVGGSITSILVRQFTTFNIDFALLFIFVLILFTFTYKLDCKLSKKQEEVKILTQTQALLEKRLRQLEKKVEAGK